QMEEKPTSDVLRRRREVEAAADQERLHLRVLDAGVLILVRARRPRVEEAATGPDQVGTGAADHRPVVGMACEEAAGVGGVVPADRGDIAPDLRPRERQL